jgi:hypothetical protein
MTDVNLNLPICFKGDLLRPMRRLNRHRFRTASYSPVAALIAEGLTEAGMETSFSGQPNCLVNLPRNIAALALFKIVVTTLQFRQELFKKSDNWKRAV